MPEKKISKVFQYFSFDTKNDTQQSFCNQDEKKFGGAQK